METSTVIVPVAWQDDAERIEPVVVEVGEVVGAPIEFVHVVQPGGRGRVLEQRLAWMKPLAERHSADLHLVEHRSVSSGVREVLVDQPDALVCMSVDATGSRLDVMDLVLGSISEDILRSGHHRCVLVGPNVHTSRLEDGPVVVCVDGSPFGEGILDDARAWVEATSAQSWLVNVSDGAPLPADLDEAGYVHEVARRLGPSTDWEVLHGRDPATAIIDFAEKVGAASIVMGTHGRSGVARAALGSVAIDVVHRATVPVLVRRPAALSVTIPG